MAEVTFLGLGLMGTALAETMLQAGHDTVVWNRTTSREEPLVARGAQKASSPAEAISESPIIVVCVGDYNAADTFLRTPDALAALKGRVLIQLTSGSAQLAQSTHGWSKEAGVLYLDGAIMGYPGDIGSPDSMIVISGDEEGYTLAEPLLRILAPKLEYLGADPARASAMDSAILSATFGLIFGMLNGAALCEATGISIRQYTKLVQPLLTMEAEAIAGSAIKIEGDTLNDTEAFLATWAAVLNPMIETMEGAGYNSEIPNFMRKMLKRAIDQGWGEYDIGALIKILRPTSK
jgi:3-hydroxyisobutyrate dehydrogenase-like beta-hydroxyacid dehydrogenase